MKTTKEVAEILADIAGCAESWEPDARLLGNIRAGSIVSSVRLALSDLSRLAEIEGATTCTPAMFDACQFTEALHAELHDLRERDIARTGELSRVRDIIQRGQSDLCDCVFCKEARAYLAEVEARDGR